MKAAEEPAEWGGINNNYYLPDSPTAGHVAVTEFSIADRPGQTAVP